jgi:hypothetical protein
MPSCSRFQSAGARDSSPRTDVLDLGGVAEAADPASQRVKLVGAVPLAHVAEAPQQLGPLLLPQRADPGEDGRGAGGARPQQPPQIAPQAVDVEVEHLLGDLRAAARASRPQAAQERPLLGGGGAQGGDTVLEEAQDHVHVPPLAHRPGQLPQDLRAFRTDRPSPLRARSGRATRRRRPATRTWWTGSSWPATAPGSSRKTRFTRSSRRTAARSSGAGEASQRRHQERIAYYARPGRLNHPRATMMGPPETFL